MEESQEIIMAKQAADNNELNKMYDEWKVNGNPVNLGRTLKAAAPIISSASKTYGGGVDVGSKAKMLTIKALGSYDKNKNASLSSHIYNQLQPLRRESLRRGNILGVSERYTQEKAKIYNARNDFLDKNDRDPDDDEIADILGLSSKRIKFLDNINNKTMSESQILDKQSEDGDASLPGVSSPASEDTWVSYVHHDAAPIDKKIIEWKTGFRGSPILSAQEIAKKLNISTAAVSQRSKKISDRIGEGIANV